MKFLATLTMLLASASFGCVAKSSDPVRQAKLSDYEQFLDSEFKRLRDADRSDLTDTEKELADTMGNDWESLELAVAELFVERLAAQCKLEAELVGEYEWQQEPVGKNGWSYLEKANQLLSDGIYFYGDHGFWDGSELLREQEQEELLDSWQRVEPLLELAAEADFLRSPEDDTGFDFAGFSKVESRAVVCDFIELQLNGPTFTRLKQIQALQAIDKTPVSSMDKMDNAMSTFRLSRAVRGGVKQGLILRTDLPEIEKLYPNMPEFVEIWEGDLWINARRIFRAEIIREGLKLYYDVVEDFRVDLPKWLDKLPDRRSFGTRGDVVLAIEWLKKNPGDLTDSVFGNRFVSQDFASKGIVAMFSSSLGLYTEAKIAKASIHLYFDKDGNPPETLPDIPMTICKIEGSEIVFYWDPSHPMVNDWQRDNPEIRRLK